MHGVIGQLPCSNEDTERDRKVERGAFLANVGRSQINRYAPRRQSKAGVHQRRPNALAALLDRPRRQTDDGPLRETLRRVDFDRHWIGFDSLDGGGADGGEHSRIVGPRLRYRRTGSVHRQALHRNQPSIRIAGLLIGPASSSSSR